MSSRQRQRTSAGSSWWRRAAVLIALALLPFWLLVRGSLYLHTAWEWHPWLALAGAASLSAVLLALYAQWLFGRLGAELRLRTLALRLALPLVFAFSLVSVAHLSAANAKTEQVRESYRVLHPSLRLAVGVARLFDSEIVLTDVQRSPADYARMGLRAPASSRHYPDVDGYVDAVDVRTLGRGKLRNVLGRLYFEVMGFETLRHGGSADHLHVSMPL